MQRKNNSMFIIVTGTIISSGRLMLGYIENNDEAILIVMALVNYIALAFVLLFINNDIANYCQEKINKAGIDTAQKKERKLVLYSLSTIYLCIYLIIGMLYIIYWKSNDLNDAISIIALALSIATNDLVISFSPLYYKCIINLLSIFKKRRKHSLK